MIGFSGKKKWLFNNGHKDAIDSEWHNDVKSGNFVYRDINGNKIYEVSYDNNVIYGDVKVFKDNGDLSSLYNTKYNGLYDAAHFFDNKKMAEFNLTSKIYVNNNVSEYSLPGVGEYIHINPTNGIHPAELYPGTIWELVSTDFILTADKSMHNLTEVPTVVMTALNTTSANLVTDPIKLFIKTNGDIEAQYVDLYRVLVYGVSYNDKGRIPYKRVVVPLDTNGEASINDIRVLFPTLISSGVRYDIEAYVITPYGKSEVATTGMSFTNQLRNYNPNSAEYFEMFNWSKVPNPYAEKENVVHERAKVRFKDKEKVYLWRRKEDHVGIGPYLYSKNFTEYHNEKRAREGAYVLKTNEYDDPYCALNGDDIIYNPDAIHPMIKRTYDEGRLNNKIELYDENGNLYNEILLDAEKNIAKGRFSNFTPADWDKPEDKLIYKYKTGLTGTTVDRSSVISTTPHTEFEDGSFFVIPPSVFDAPAGGIANPTPVEAVDNMYDNYHRRNIYGIPDKNIEIRIVWGHKTSDPKELYYTTKVISNKDPKYFYPNRYFDLYNTIVETYKNDIHNNKKDIKEMSELNPTLDMMLMFKAIDVVIDADKGYVAEGLYPGIKWHYGVNTKFGPLDEMDTITVFPRFYTDNVRIVHDDDSHILANRNTIKRESDLIKPLRSNFNPKHVTREISFRRMPAPITEEKKGDGIFNIAVAYNTVKSGTVNTNTKASIELPIKIDSNFIDYSMKVIRVGAVLEHIHNNINILYDEQYKNIEGIKPVLRQKLAIASNIIEYIPFIYISVHYTAEGRKVRTTPRKISTSPYTILLERLEWEVLTTYNGTIVIYPMWEDKDTEYKGNPYNMEDAITLTIDWGYDEENNRVKYMRNINLFNLWNTMHNTVNTSLRIPEYTKIGELKLYHLIAFLNEYIPDDTDVSDQGILNDIFNMTEFDPSNHLDDNVSATYDVNKTYDGFTGLPRDSFFMRRNYMFLSDDERYVYNYKYNMDNNFNINVDKVFARESKEFTIYTIPTKSYIARFHWDKGIPVDKNMERIEDQVSVVKGLQIDERVISDPIITSLITKIAKKLKRNNHPDYKYFTSEYAYYKFLGADISAAINKTIPKSAIISSEANNENAFIFSDSMVFYHVMNNNNVYVEDAKETWYNISKYLNVYRNKQRTVDSRIIYNPEYQIKDLDQEFFDLSHNVDLNILFPGTNRSFELYLAIETPEKSEYMNPYRDEDIIRIKWDKDDDDNIVSINLRDLWFYYYETNRIRPNQKFSEVYSEGIPIDFHLRLKEFILKHPEKITNMIKDSTYLKRVKTLPEFMISYFDTTFSKGNELYSDNTADNCLISSKLWTTFRYITAKDMKLEADKEVPFSYITSKTDLSRAFLDLPIQINPDEYLKENSSPIVFKMEYVFVELKKLVLDISNTSWTFTETAPPNPSDKIYINSFKTLVNDNIPELKELNRLHALRYMFDTKDNTFFPDHMTYVWDPSRSLLGSLSSFFRPLDAWSVDYDIDKLVAIVRYPNNAIEIKENKDTVIVNVKYEIPSQIHFPDMRPMVYIIEPTDYDKIIPMVDNVDNLRNNSLLSFTDIDGKKAKLSDIVVALPEAVMYEWYMWTGVLSQTSAKDGYYTRNNLDWFNTDKNIYGSNIVEFITEKIRELRSAHGLSTTDKFPKTVEEFNKAKWNIYFISDPIKDPPIVNTLDESSIYATKERIFTRWIHMKDNFKYMKEFANYTALGITGKEFLHTNKLLKIPTVQLDNKNPSNGYPAKVPMMQLFFDIDGTMRVGTSSSPVMIIELVIE